MPPQIVVGIPLVEDVPGLRVRRGADGQLRANHYTVMFLFLTDQLVSTYECLLQFGTGNIMYDRTHEHHYRDIVGVSSFSKPLSRESSKEFADAGIDGGISLMHVFSLSITNGAERMVNTGFGGPEARADGKVAWHGNERVQSVVQRMIRSRHSK